MVVVTDRKQVLEIFDEARKKKAVIPLFCADSLPNIEANLRAVLDYSQEHSIKSPIVGISMTYDYESMSQAGRVYSEASKQEGFETMFAILDILCNRDFGTYRELRVLPHLDHADAEKEEWLWKEYLPDLATVMVDASLNDRSLEENIRLTKKMVDSYGKKIVIEGALQRPAVEGHHAAGELAGADTDADYAAQAKSYVQKTGVDLVVLELGAKQQALGWSEYNSARARAVTGALGKSMIVLHGGSSIPLGQQATLGDDGILRFNIWTRMAREAAEAAAEAIVAQIADIRAGDRVQKYRLRYTEAHFDQQVKSLKEVLQATGYGRFAGN